MEKSAVETFIGNLETAKVDNYSIRYEGGNRFSSSNSDSGRILLADDHVTIVEIDNYHAYHDGRFTVRSIPYDNIDNIYANGLTTKQIVDFLKAEGTWNEDVEKLISGIGGRIVLQPGHGGYGEVQDKDGNPILNTDLPGRVTTGQSV